MKTISANNYSQAVKEVEILDKEQSNKVKEAINFSDRKHNHVVTVKVLDRPGEAKNKVVINTIIINDDKLEKIKKNYKFLGYSKLIILHDGSQVKEDDQPTLHVHDKQAIEAKVKAELEAKHKAEMDEVRKKYELEALESKKQDPTPPVPSDFETEYTNAMSGKKDEMVAFLDKYGINGEELTNEEKRKEAITAFYNAKMIELDESSN